MFLQSAAIFESSGCFGCKLLRCSAIRHCGGIGCPVGNQRRGHLSIFREKGHRLRGDTRIRLGAHHDEHEGNALGLEELKGGGRLTRYQMGWAAPARSPDLPA